MVLRKAFGIATVCVATLLMSLAPAQAYSVNPGDVRGAFPVTITSSQPTAMTVNFNRTFSVLYEVCVSLDLRPANGGEGLGVDERVLMVVPGGGTGTVFRNDLGRTNSYPTICTRDPADLALFKRGAWQVRFFMQGDGSIRATGASAYAQ